MNPNNPDWRELRKKITEQIELLRDDLETVGINPDPLRGQIASLRWVIDTVEPPKPIEIDEDNDYHLER